MTAKIKILIVEDDIPTAMMMVYLLTKAGCEVLAAHTGKNGMELATKRKFGLIVLGADLGISGFEICEELKQRHLSRLTPIVLVSGRPTDEDRKRSHEIGAADFIVKPFDADEFVRRLLALVGPTDEISVSG